MKAVGFQNPGPLSDDGPLVDLNLPEPVPEEGDLLVRVEAVAVNQIDVKLRSTVQPEPGAPRILGYDAAGTVIEVGSATSRFKAGDRVFYAGSVMRQGSYAELQVVDERLVGRMPGTIPFAEAAALPLSALTAWELLFERLLGSQAKSTSGDALLIINGAGGVGSVLTMLARKLTALNVIATASRAESRAWCLEMGAHHVIDHTSPLSSGLSDIGIDQVRYVAGLTATDRHRDEIVRVLAPRGALALIDDPASFDIKPFRPKSLSVHWEGMFTRSTHHTADMAQQGRILDKIANLVDQGELHTTARHDFGRIDAANLRRAHAALETGRTVGKIVLGGF